MNSESNQKLDNTYVWNPWHGCHKCSKGCLRCYIFEDDRNKGINTNKIKLNRTQFRLPVRKEKRQNKLVETYELSYKVPSGSIINVCQTSDFFIEEADIWRNEAWEFIHRRNDCFFIIETKRPERIKQCLPSNWLLGWENVMIKISVEDDNTAYTRMQLALELNIKHLGITIAPMLESMDIRPYLSSGLIDIVEIRGESYKGYDGIATILDYTWVEDIKNQCIEYDTKFKFVSTGTRLRVKDGKVITILSRSDEHGLADFYELNNGEDIGIDWKETAKKIKQQELIEEAYKINQLIRMENERHGADSISK